MGIFLLIMLIFLLILTPPVQSFIRKKATAYLREKLDTKVTIGRLFITLSGKIALDDIYIEDRQKDTLLSAGKLRVNMSFSKLLFDKEVDIKSILLNDATAKIKRQLPDTAFNFQFIIDAFSSGSPDSLKVTDTSASMAFAIHSVELNKLRFVYNDIVTGNDIETSLGHFDMKIEKFDIDKLHFVVPQVNINELTAKIIQLKPMVLIKPEVIDSTKLEKAGSASPVLQLDIKHVSLQKSAIDYRDSTGAVYAFANVGQLDVKPGKIDLANNVFDLGKVSLDKTKAVVKLGKTSAVTPKKKNISNDTLNASPGVTVAFSSLGVNGVSLQYDNDNEPLQKKGMDYSHINAVVNTLQVNEFLFNNDSIKGVVAKANLEEQSGFELQELSTDFLYTGNQAHLQDLYLKTPGTELKRDVTIRYASLKSLSGDIANLQLDADIIDSKVLVKDILTFVPSLQQQPAFSDPTATWYVDGRITGRVGDMQIDRLKISGLANTRIDITGKITGLPETKKINADLHIKELSSSRTDMLAILPKNTLPKNISLPGRMNLTGKIRGGMKKLNTDILLKTDLGNVSVKGMMQNISDARQAQYDVVVNTSSLDLGTLLKDKQTYGPVSATIIAKGKGYDVKTANATLKGVVQSAVFKRYNYHDLTLDAGIANQQVTAVASIKDPNIHFALNGTADLSKEYPAVQLDLVIDSIKTKELHLTPDVLVYRGKIKADFPMADPDSLNGKLFITESLLVTNKERIQLDTVQLIAGNEAGKNFLTFNSDIVNAKLEGQYKLTQLADVFMQSIEPYYKINAGAKSIVQTASYDFTLNATVIDKPLLRSLVPGIEKLQGVMLQSHFSSKEGVNATLTATEIAMNDNQVKGLQLNAVTADSALIIKMATQHIQSGSSISIDSTILTASLANNTIDFDLDIKDKAAKDKYSIAGKLQQSANGDLAFSIKPDGLLLNYEKWQMAAGNKILIGSQGINASNFTLEQNRQQLSLNSVSSATNAPMKATFTDFRIATLTAIAMSDSAMIDGRVTGELTVKDLTTTPLFTGDLAIADLSYRNDTIGNVQAKVNNTTANVYAADITLSGRGNDAVIAGSYNTASSLFDLDMDLKQLPLKTAEAFSAGAIRNTTGFVSGHFKIRGIPQKPSVMGDLNFNKAGLTVTTLNSYFTIDNEKIQFTDQGLEFDRFQVKDSAGNNLTLNGTVATANYMNYKFDLGVRANNFKALNSTKKDNKLFYGQFYFNTNLKIKGTEAAPVIDGTLTINEKTKMTIVLPQPEPGVVDREGVIEFIDMDAPVNDSLFMLAYDSLNTSSFTGMDVSLNITVDKAADFTLIIDEGNGDFLNVKGEAELVAGVDPSGKITLVGSYELEEGAYELSFNLVRKKFYIQKGSKIVWEGEPTSATVDITAKYTANTAPLDLVKGQLDENLTAQERNTYLQKLPFDVNLKMEGKLLKPQITFDIILPENKNYGVSNNILTNVRTKLEQLRQSTGDMNKQVFSLLLLNRFVTENPFASSGGTSAATLLRQSVSKLMAEQLNRLAEGLINGVDINLGIESSADYTTGEKQDKTDLNVGISKRLLNDRLTVSVGSNFAIEGVQNSNQQSNNIAGNVAIDYALSSDGRYKIRAYRKNDYQGVIDGYIVETGVAFIITLDFNKFQQIFQSKKKQDQLRKERREQWLKEEEQKKETKTADSK